MSALSNFRTGPNGPATHVFAITPHDTNPLPAVVKALRVNTNGNIVIRTLDSEADVTLAVLAGQMIDAVVTHVRATGTTATVHGFA